MKKYLVFLILIINPAIAGLNWENTGDLTGARYILGLTQGLNGYLYTGAIIDTSSADSGWCFYSTDFFNWQRCANLPGDQRGVYHLINGIGDTLFAGSSYWNGSAWEPRVYKSGDAGQNWTMLGSIPTPISGTQVWAVLEGSNRNLYAGINWLSVHQSALPVRSTDRGATWLNGINSSPYAPVSEFALIEASDNNLYVGTWAGQRRLVYKSTNQGQNWIETDTMFDSGQARAITEGPLGILFAGTYPRTVPQENIGRVFKSTNGGTTWQQIGYGYFSNTTGIRSLFWTSDGRLFAGTVPNGEVFVSCDTGNTWQSEGFLSGANAVYRFLEVVIADSIYLYAATGPNGDVFRALIGFQVGISEPFRPAEKQSAFRINNPTKGVLRIKYQGAKTKVEVYDLSGKRVSEFVLNNGDNRLTIDKRLPSGVYYLRLKESGQSIEKNLFLR